jgi:oligoribonuclease
MRICFDTSPCFPYILAPLFPNPCGGLDFTVFQGFDGGWVLRKNLVWMDLEMSGLDPEKEVILEIAAIVTDSDLGILAEGPAIAIHHPDAVLRNMEAWSKKQHRASGLVDRVKASVYDCRKAEEEILGFVSKHCKKGESPLCGNSIWQDRRFLVRHMPRLEEFFHYRIVDVSSIKELVRRWYPSLSAYRKKKTHLALNDIRESIEELRYYRDRVFIPE